jgi:ketosteroid isomerase-like protein
MKPGFFAVMVLLAMLADLSAQINPPAAKAPEDPAHQELRILRTNVVDAIIKGDVESVLPHLHTNVVITWQNNEVCRGHQGVREFFHRMGKHAFRSYKIPPTPDELTILHGSDTGVVFGNSVGQYALFGHEYEFQNRWTATVVKENGRWQLASYHVSLNALNNPLLDAAKKSLFVIGGIGTAIGLILGTLIGRSIQGRKSSTPARVP